MLGKSTQMRNPFVIPVVEKLLNYFLLEIQAK